MNKIKLSRIFPCLYNDSGKCEATGEYCGKEKYGCDGYVISTPYDFAKLGRVLFPVRKDTEKKDFEFKAGEMDE